MIADKFQVFNPERQKRMLDANVSAKYLKATGDPFPVEERIVEF